MRFNEDLYWENKREEMERDTVVATCDCCGEKIMESQVEDEGYYDLGGETLHRECLEEWFADNLIR